jgi:hypothetical protein
MRSGSGAIAAEVARGESVEAVAVQDGSAALVVRTSMFAPQVFGPSGKCQIDYSRASMFAQNATSQPSLRHRIDNILASFRIDVRAASSH